MTGEEMRDSLKLDEDSSGQKINFQKCVIFFSWNTCGIQSLLGLHVSSTPTLVGEGKEEGVIQALPS